MSRYLLLLALWPLSLSLNVLAQDENTASGMMVVGKHKVTIKYVYMVSAAEGDNKGRRLIFSASDIAADIGKCTTISCTSKNLNEGFTLELDSPGRMNLWAVANNQMAQHSDTVVHSMLKTSVDKPDAVAGVLAIDRPNVKINVEFKIRLTKTFKS